MKYAVCFQRPAGANRPRGQEGSQSPTAEAGTALPTRALLPGTPQTQNPTNTLNTMYTQNPVIQRTAQTEPTGTQNSTDTQNVQGRSWRMKPVRLMSLKAKISHRHVPTQQTHTHDWCFVFYGSVCKFNVVVIIAS